MASEGEEVGVIAVSKSAAPSIAVDPFILVASSCSAISARLCTHPLDTLRVRVQTWPGAVVPPLKELVPKPRMRTLYAGLPTALAVSIPALSVYLVSYEISKKYLASKLLPQDHKPSLLQQLPIFMLSGMAAEGMQLPISDSFAVADEVTPTVASGAIWTPGDVVRQRLQRGGEGTNSGAVLLRKIWKEEGYRGVWRGYWMSMVVFIPYISLFWASYESLKTRFIPDYDAYRPSPITSSPVSGIPIAARYTLCSVTACAFAATITTPIELVQARWQTSKGLATDGITGIVKELWRQGGFKAFTRGLGMRIAYGIPANAISMTTYEGIKRWKGI